MFQSQTLSYASDKKLSQSYCNTITSQPGTSNTSLSRNQASSNSADQKTLSNVSCTYCKWKGNLNSECFHLKRKLQFKECIKPTGLTSQIIFSQVLCWKNAIFEVTKSQNDTVMEIHKPLLFEGSISLVGDSTKPIPIKILRNRCFS